MKNILKSAMAIFMALAIMLCMGCSTPAGSGNGGGSGDGGSNPPIVLTEDTDFEALKSDKFTEDEKQEIINMLAYYSRPHGLFVYPDYNFTTKGTLHTEDNAGSTDNIESTIYRKSGVLYISEYEVNREEWYKELYLLDSNAVVGYVNYGLIWTGFGKITNQQYQEEEQIDLNEAKALVAALVYDESESAYVVKDYVLTHETDGEITHGVIYNKMILKVVDGKIAYMKLYATTYSRYPGEEDYEMHLTQEFKFFDYGTTNFEVPDVSGVIIPE